MWEFRGAQDGRARRRQWQCHVVVSREIRIENRTIGPGLRTRQLAWNPVRYAEVETSEAIGQVPDERKFWQHTIRMPCVLSQAAKGWDDGVWVTEHWSCHAPGSLAQ